MLKITASYEFSGMPDYWSGNGRRWDDNAGCVFAYYGPTTTLRDIIDQLAEDFNDGGDFYPREEGSDPWADVTSDDVKAAILDALTDRGRADYENDVISEFAEEYRDANDWHCEDCGAALGDVHNDDCGWAGEPVEYDECIGDCCDSPMVVFLLELEDEDDEDN